jgi:hypothetical protein
MKYAVQMRSSANIYMPRFINTGSGVKKLMGGCIQTHKLAVSMEIAEA